MSKTRVEYPYMHMSGSRKGTRNRWNFEPELGITVTDDEETDRFINKHNRNPKFVPPLEQIPSSEDLFESIAEKIDGESRGKSEELSYPNEEELLLGMNESLDKSESPIDFPNEPEILSRFELEGKIGNMPRLASFHKFPAYKKKLKFLAG